MQQDTGYDWKKKDKKEKFPMIRTMVTVTIMAKDTRNTIVNTVQNPMDTSMP